MCHLSHPMVSLLPTHDVTATIEVAETVFVSEFQIDSSVLQYK